MVFRIPDDSSTMMVFGESRENRFTGDVLRVMVWNVWKGKTGPRWRRDFVNLAADRDLILLQEAVTAPEMMSLFATDAGPHEWHMAASFQWRFSHMTGVITGGLCRPFAKSFIRGSERELFLWTPKVTLSTTYDLEGHGPILVINTHVVNFTTNGSFVRFIEEILRLIEAHSDSVILAGDFNTWNPGRWRSLVHIFRAIGLEAVDFNADPRAMKLDHVFVRGLKPVRAFVRGDIKSSDHYPLIADFEVLR